ncbi:hypothetical protein G6F60_014611 [Rhizopus arrhizus]|nr:hypothetical protein G6F60_014611 [Rhizopus arrhizus]
MLVDEAAEIGQCIFKSRQCGNRLVLGFGLLGSTADDRADTREDLHVIAAAAMRDRRIFHLLGECTGFFQRRRMGEHRIGILAGQRDAIIGRASLEDHRLALRRTLDVERPFHLEKAALVVEPTERVRREERATPAPPPGTRRDRKRVV